MWSVREMKITRLSNVLHIFKLSLILNIRNICVYVCPIFLKHHAQSQFGILVLALPFTSYIMDFYSLEHKYHLKTTKTTKIK